MQSHLNLFTQFCNDLGHQPFPVQVTTILRHLAFLSASGRAFGTIQNHISSIKHFHLLLGFASFLSKVITPHSFRRGGASFAFECNVPAELIKFQGDWRSDAYLVYLEMSSSQKRLAVNSMASRIRQLKI